LCGLTTLPITAAGGITSIEDVTSLLAMNVDAAIGMAVYTGRLSLTELLALTV
jgi:phosphoribosylformimino-5-aminoimidazole carboxamide ribonucleotide (ProFAR) isomerase